MKSKIVHAYTKKGKKWPYTVYYNTIQPVSGYLELVLATKFSKEWKKCGISNSNVLLSATSQPAFSFFYYITVLTLYMCIHAWYMQTLDLCTSICTLGNFLHIIIELSKQAAKTLYMDTHTLLCLHWHLLRYETLLPTFLVCRKSKLMFCLRASQSSHSQHVQIMSVWYVLCTFCPNK